MKSTQSVILLAYTWLISDVFKAEVAALSEPILGSGLGSGGNDSILGPEESTVMTTEPVSASSIILDTAMTPTTTQTTATVELAPDIVATTTTTTAGEQMPSRSTASLPASAIVSPTTTSRVVSVLTMSRSLTQISASVATPTMDSSSASILTERETTTIVRSLSEETRTTLSLTTLPTFSSVPLTRAATLSPSTIASTSLSTIEPTPIMDTTVVEIEVMTTLSLTTPPTFSSVPLTSAHVAILSPSILASMSLSTIEPTPTMATTAAEIEVATTTEQTITTRDDSSTAEGEGDITSAGDFGLATNNQLSTVDILIIVLATVVFLIIVFVIASCVFIGLICKRCKKEDPVKREILSSWVLQEPPKRAGPGVRLMNIRTLDSMDELCRATEATSLDGRETEGEPRGTVDRKLRAMSNMGSSTAFTFGVPMGVAKTVGGNGETTTAVESRQNGGSDTLGDSVVQNEISGFVNGVKETKASVVVEVPPTEVTTFSTNTFEPVLRPTKDPNPKKAGASIETDGAAIVSREEQDKSSLLAVPKTQLEQQNLLSSEDVEKAFGTQSLFQDLEVSTEL